MAHIEFRKDEAPDWSASDYILYEGEPGLNLTTGGIRIGDGESRWDDLPEFVPTFPTDQAVTSDQLQAHIDSLTPHPVYDDGPSLYLLYENAKV